MRTAGLLAVLAVFVCGVCVSSTPVAEQPLVGASKCTWGPSYWCDNLSNSKDCRATRHCIQTVWEKRSVAVDTDSICQICKDMVTQARDQLRSNQTEDELRQVFEGSCKLIPIKLVQKKCITLADNFVPELVEALSSQMNPDQVCSVAGLCNSARIDELMKHSYESALEDTIKEEEVDLTSGAGQVANEESASTQVQLSCGNCNLLSGKIQRKFESTNRDNMVEQLLHWCGTMSSFSDACANLVLTYFNDMYDHVQQHLKSNGLCHLSGVCAARYHQHEDDVKEPETLTTLEGVGDDIPCALCEQLVKHLRDVLVANTTETEFKQVLEGFCNQSRGFKDQCISIVDEYYHVIYNTLVNKLDANGTCFLIGVCPKGLDIGYDAPIMPLLSVIAPAEVHVTIKKLGANEPKFSQEQIMSMQLPIDNLMGAANPDQLVNGGELCTICEYLLHFIQESLATPATDDEIKHEVENICTKLPGGVASQCRNFVEMYGDAIISLLIQGLNPRSVCPMAKMCPRNIENFADIEVFFPSPVSSDQQDKPTCPLCLFAVEQAQIKIRDNKSKENIKKVLDGLCTHLPSKLRTECVDFVETYSNELIDMLITDFKPEEICVQLKLCPKTRDYLDEVGITLLDNANSDTSSSSEEIADNEIDSNNELPIEIAFGRHLNLGPTCVLCEELVKIVEKKVGKHWTKPEIKIALENSCDKLKDPLANKCHKFIDKHGNQIADFLIKEMSPKLICLEIGMCLGDEQEDLEIDEALKYDIIVMPNPQDNKLARLESKNVDEPPTCVLCEFVMTKLEADLQNKTEQDEIKKAIYAVCEHLPSTIRKQCDTFVDGYASAIISLLSKVPPKEVCQKLQFCLSQAVNDEVIECGVCHGASQVLLPFFRGQKDTDNITVQNMISEACENLPAKYYNICSEMISIYGFSILNLAERPYIDQSHVCAEIGKCFDGEKSALAFARISA